VLPFAATHWPTASIGIGAWSAAIAIGVVCTGYAFLLYYRLIHRIGPARASTVTYLVPLFGAAFAWLFLGEPVTPAMLAAGSAGWEALRAPTPEPATELVRSRLDALPYLPAALARHLRELPSTENGLGRTEQLALEAVESGAATAGAVFEQVQEREPAPWLGDAMLYAILAALSRMRTPLVRLGGSWPADGAGFAASRVGLTDAARAVLGRKVDAVALAGIERWVGGVELRGTRAAWRWDEATRRPVPG
jgi:hypothetical protein